MNQFMADEPTPDAEAASPSSASRHPGKTIPQCQVMIQKALKRPMVKFLLEQMGKSGCKVPDGFIKAVHCDKKFSGAFHPHGGRGIEICSNHMVFQDQVNQVVAHELIHAFDDCRAGNMKWGNERHQACSEIRANHLSRDCAFLRELLRGGIRRANWKVKGHEQVCVKRRAILSTSSNHSEAKAKEAVEAVWDICYNDAQPFDKAP